MLNKSVHGVAREFGHSSVTNAFFFHFLEVITDNLKYYLLLD